MYWPSNSTSGKLSQIDESTLHKDLFIRILITALFIVEAKQW